MLFENKKVDYAGYLITTGGELRGVANGLIELSSNEVGDTNIFGEALSEAKCRADYALALRRYAETLGNLALEMDAPLVDESGSDQIGFDAAHSIKPL